MLLNENYNREEKIALTNEVMTLLFPRLEGDKVTFIGSTFMKYGEPEPYLNHCLVLNTCDEVDGAVIESVNTETEILCKWTELIQKENLFFEKNVIPVFNMYRAKVFIYLGYVYHSVFINSRGRFMFFESIM